jgi:hypothetical protein
MRFGRYDGPTAARARQPEQPHAKRLPVGNVDTSSVVSTTISVVVCLVAIIWLLPLAVDVAWQLIPSILILILIVGAIRGIVSRLFD